jgi:pyruvate dehydrogenase E1 component
MLKPVTTDIEALKILDERLLWLSAWTIHHANHIRPSDDGLKVGGHQASCATARSCGRRSMNIRS